MKKFVVVLAVVLLCGGLCGRPAYAGVGDWVKNSVSYLWSPVPCLGILAKNLVADLVNFTGCVIGNANRVPTTLAPVLPPPVPQPAP